LENHAKGKIALGLVGIGFAMMLFNYLFSFLSYYFAPLRPFSKNYLWSSAIGLFGAMSIIVGFLIIASFLLDKDRLRRIAQVSLVAALILGSVAGAGLTWIDYDLFFAGQYLPLDTYLILRFITHLATVLAFLGIALIIYSLATPKFASQETE
jgi:hypothetical protein